MTLWSAASCLAVALLVALLMLLGTRLRGLSSERDGAAFRLVVASIAGAVVFYLLLTGLDLLRIPWHPLVLAGSLGGAIALAHRYLHIPAVHTPSTAAKARPSWGDGIALLALAAFAWFAVSLCNVIPDFYFHWGLKGERFFLARGTDYDFLAMPWNEVLARDYPTLLPDLYAAAALLAGRFSARAMMLWSVGVFGLLLLAGREALRQAGVVRFVAESTLALTALAVAAAGIRGNMAGGADWMISLALVVAMPALMRPPDRAGNVQLGVAAAFAAAAKLEGSVLAAILIVVQSLRGLAGPRSGRRFDFPAFAALLLPALAVVVHWQAEVRRFHLARPYYGGINLHHGQAILSAVRYELTASPTWHGFAYSLLLLPLLAFRRRLRPVVAVLAMQLAFYLYSYYSFLFDPVPLVLTSFDRLELHLVPAILFASGIALESGAHGSRAPELAASGAMVPNGCQE
ncbi:MAG TPA: hypothetical protein VHB47_04270 [Thermoanaerobaculia bacterium]|nr:hypothetical protein [Thermoanaerobaculia bacterium]